MHIFKTMILAIALLTGCTNVVRPKIEKPPYQDKEAYQDGYWILLAESTGKNWYYDPSTLVMNDSGLVEFNSFWAPIFDKESDKEFNSGATGPYRQKLDCLEGNHLSQTIRDEVCDSELAGSANALPKKRDRSACWSLVKPRTAMAMITTRICGMQLPFERNKEYFLYQVGRINPSSPAKQNLATSQSSVKQQAPIFYDVVNNEFVYLDPKHNIREMKVVSYFLDQNLHPNAEYSYRANCEAGLYSLSQLGAKSEMTQIGEPTSLSGVAFNRLCGKHGRYMHEVKTLSN